MEICIDRGFQTYEIKDADGTPVGEIRINPADMGLAGRWQQALLEVEKLAARGADGPAALLEADRAIRAQLDYAFGTPVSEVLFAGASCLALCADGRLVLENVLDALAPILEKAQRAAARQSAARIQARTAPYLTNREMGLAPGQAAGATAERSEAGGAANIGHSMADDRQRGFDGRRNAGPEGRQAPGQAAGAGLEQSEAGGAANIDKKGKAMGI